MVVFGAIGIAIGIAVLALAKYFYPEGVFNIPFAQLTLSDIGKLLLSVLLGLLGIWVIIFSFYQMIDFIRFEARNRHRNKHIDSD